MSNNLTRVRQTHGYKYANEFAASLYIPLSTYTRYERNDESLTSIPTKTLLRIADKLGVTLDEIFFPQRRSEEDELVCRINSLSPMKRAMMLSYLDYLSKTDNI